MKLRIYCHNGTDENERDYVECDLLTFNAGDILRVADDHFTAMGYLTVKYCPENKDEERSLYTMPWQPTEEDYHAYYNSHDDGLPYPQPRDHYTWKCKPQILCGCAMQRISSQCFAGLVDAINKDKEHYLRTMTFTPAAIGEECTADEFVRAVEYEVNRTKHGDVRLNYCKGWYHLNGNGHTMFCVDHNARTVRMEPHTYSYQRFIGELPSILHNHNT